MHWFYLATCRGRSIIPYLPSCYRQIISQTRFCLIRSFCRTMNDELFVGTLDIHRGITVDSRQEPCQNITEFRMKLEESLKKWKEGKIRGVWFNVHLRDGEWIPVLANNGFRVHHGSGEVVSLVRWLPMEEQSRIPAFAHTMVGAGAVVINDKRQVLVVCERYRNIPYWKLPGGYVEPGEDIVDAVQREVQEETNIRTEFVSVVSFRHTLKSNFGCSDIYFVVELKPLNFDIKKEDEEIEASQWMDVDEYLEHPMVHENNRLFVRKCLGYKVKNILIERETTFHPITKKPQALYTANNKLPYVTIGCDR